ncbi:hypothetical protein [Mycobacteroides franklinii]|nr:hypothetical protein [Mycobacteroides franklinii]
MSTAPKGPPPIHPTEGRTVLLSVATIHEVVENDSVTVLFGKNA